MFGFQDLLFALTVFLFGSKFLSGIINIFSELLPTWAYKKSSTTSATSINIPNVLSLTTTWSILLAIILAMCIGYRYQIFMSLWQMFMEENDNGNTEDTIKKKRRHILSPINIDTLNAKCVIANENTLQWEDHDQCPGSMKLYNDGETVCIVGSWDNPPAITGEAIGNRRYEFSYMYFTWGGTDHDGAEHTINYKRCPMELHMVYIDVPCCSTKEDASEKPSVIVAVQFEANPSPNVGFIQTIMGALPKVICPFTTCSITPFCLASVVQPFSENFFLYCGTHGCLHDPAYFLLPAFTLPISRCQIQEFRRIRNTSGNPTYCNNRPRNQTKHRVIRYNSVY